MSKRAFDKIAEGLTEALAIARGEAKPAKLHIPAEIEGFESLGLRLGTGRSRVNCTRISRRSCPRKENARQQTPR